MSRTRSGLVASFVLLAGATSAAAADGDGFRPYVALRVGGSVFVDPTSVANIVLESPSQYPFPSLVFGANLDRHWGVEFAADFSETALGAEGVTSQLGEYAIWHLLGQVRLRQPLWNDRLVPYVIAGAGLGIAEFNDRDADFLAYPFNGGDETSFLAAVGAGVDLFVSDNIAINIEAKRTFFFRPEVRINGQAREIDADNIYIAGGLRLFFDRGSGWHAGDAPPSLTDDLRFYVNLGTGAAFLLHPHPGDGVLEIDTPVRAEYSVAAGIQFDRHWAVELNGDYYEPGISSPGFGEVAEYALFTAVGNVRYSHPVLADRLIPYVAAGAGIGYSQVNDRRVPTSVFPIYGTTETSLIGSVGAGVDYLLEPNIAIGLDAHYLFNFENRVEVGASSFTIDNDTLFVGARLRIQFP